MQRGGHQNRGPMRARYDSSQQDDMYQGGGQHEQVAGGPVGGGWRPRRGRAPRYFRNHDQSSGNNGGPVGYSSNYYNNNNKLDPPQPPAPPTHQHPQQHHHHHSNNQQHQPQQQQQVNNQKENKKVEELSKSLLRHKTELVELKSLFANMCLEMELVATRVKELEKSASLKSHDQQVAANNDKENKRKEKKLKQREKRAQKWAEKRAQITTDNNNATSHHPDGGDTQQQILSSQEGANLSDKPPASGLDANGKPADSQQAANGGDSTTGQQQDQQVDTNNRQPYNRHKKRFQKRDFKEKINKPLPKVNKSTHVNHDDSTTQAAEPSSEDRLEGEDGREGTGKERIKIRRKKQHMGRRGAYSNRRRRAESSERNSNDTSPQGEGNASDKEKASELIPASTVLASTTQADSADQQVKPYPELDEAQLNEVVQTLKREFLNLDRPVKAIKETMNTKGPKVVYEFAVSILDHAICDVTSPSKLTKIANSLYELTVAEVGSNEVDFKQGFYDALKDISKREEDIAIDAPRYMDTLGQLLADCIVPMWSEHKDTIKPFLENVLESYCEQNRASLLSSITKGIASAKSDEFAKEVLDLAELNK